MSIILKSCECVPDINTPKQITPTDFAYCYFLNASTSYDNLTIESDAISIINNLEFSTPQSSYEKVNSGNSYIRIITSDKISTLLNTPASFVKGSYYTFIPYGSGSSLRTMFISDTIKKMSNSISMIRFINISQDVPIAKFEVNSANPISKEIAFKSASPIEQIDFGIYNIKLSIGSEIKFDMKNIQLNPAKIYNIILKGKSTATDSKKLVCQICEVNLP